VIPIKVIELKVIGLRMKREQERRTNMKRSRGRGRRPGNSSGRSLDSSGPEVKIRGSASHILEKYQALAQDANVAGDHVASENYLQHAEHYFRMLRSAQSNAAEGERAAKPDSAATNGEDPAVGAEATEGNGEAVDDAQAKTSRRHRPRRQAQDNGASSRGTRSNGQTKAQSDPDSQDTEETTAQ